MYSRYYNDYDIHYVIMETVNANEYWVNVFDYKNLMLYLLDVTQNLSNKEIYYIDKLYRRYKTKNLCFEGYHKLNKSNLIKQAYEYEAQYLNQYIYIEYLDIYEEPDRDWKDLFYCVPIHKSDWVWDNRFGYIIPYRYNNHPKSHRQGSYGVPKHMWNKIKTEHILAAIVDEYEEDYSPYITHKTRYSKSSMLGWWDDYYRRKKSSGWKESSKRKHQWKIKKE